MTLPPRSWQVRAWDTSQDFTFSSREFLIMMKKIILNNAHDGAHDRDDRKPSGPFALGPSAPQHVAGKTDAVPAWLLKLASCAPEELTAEHARAIKAAVMLQARVRERLARRRMPSNKKKREATSKLWYEQIKPVTQRVFADISGGDGDVDIQEFVRWLNEEWRAQRLAKRRIMPPAEGGKTTAQEAEARRCWKRRRRKWRLASRQWLILPPPPRPSVAGTCSRLRIVRPSSPSDGVAATEPGRPRSQSVWRRYAEPSDGIPCRCGTT